MSDLRLRTRSTNSGVAPDEDAAESPKPRQVQVVQPPPPPRRSSSSSSSSTSSSLSTQRLLKPTVVTDEVAPPESPKAQQQPPPPPRRSLSYSSPSQRVLSQALTSTANLANLLPTGTLLAFQLLTPVFTNNGSCDAATRAMASILLVILAASCILASFTDSVKLPDGQVYYGFATFTGLWLFDSQGAVASCGPSGIPDLNKYKLGFIDWVHAVLSAFVFGVVALRDKNVVGCFYPKPDHEIQEVLDIIPIGIGVLCGSLFMVFPTKRHGIGYPVTPAS